MKSIIAYSHGYADVSRKKKSDESRLRDQKRCLQEYVLKYCSCSQSFSFAAGLVVGDVEGHDGVVLPVGPAGAVLQVVFVRKSVIFGLTLVVILSL